MRPGKVLRHPVREATKSSHMGTAMGRGEELLVDDDSINKSQLT